MSELHYGVLMKLIGFNCQIRFAVLEMSQNATITVFALTVFVNVILKRFWLMERV